MPTTATSTCNTFCLENTSMDKFEIFDKVSKGKEVYLLDQQGEVAMKCYADGDRVGAMLKPKGKRAYKVDVRATDIFDTMNESSETTKEVYDEY